MMMVERRHIGAFSSFRALRFAIGVGGIECGQEHYWEFGSFFGLATWLWKAFFSQLYWHLGSGWISRPVLSTAQNF
jgi:hypothetical protein